MALPRLLQKLFTNEGAGDKLNKGILPDISYNDLTDKPVIPTVPTKVSAFENDAGYLTQHQSLDAYATKASLKAVATSGSYNDLTDKPAVPTVDSALSSTSENPVQNKVINSALDGKLSTSGGMMTGGIMLNASLAGIVKADKNGSLVLSGGNTISSGGAGSAILWLGGGDDSSAFNSPGVFSLEASKGTWGQSGFLSHELRGTPDGSLTWGGKNVLTGNSAGLTVVAESYSANSWYRKYSDGWIEQGGTVSGTAANFKGYSPRVTTNFPVAFSKTPTIATIEVLPGRLNSGGGVTKRTGRLSLQSSGEDSMGDTVYYYGVIEASSTGMTIRVTSSDYGASVTATVYYVVVGK